MAFAVVDDVVASLAAGQIRPILFPSVTTVIGRLTDMNAAGVGRYGQMATPAAIGAGGTLHAKGDAGFPTFNNAASGKELRLALASLSLQTVGTIILYERIWSCRGMNGTLNTPQAIAGFPALTIPDANGTDLEMFAEVYTQIGVTGTTLTASYTNSAGTAGRTTLAQSIGNTGLREVYRLIPLPLQVGDTGVQSIQSATLAATTGTAGDFGLVLCKRLATLHGGVVQVVHDFARLGIPKIDAGAAIMVALMASSTTSGIVDGQITLGEN